ncbi:MAG: helix-turn-helix transcriptional regulator [Bifidobacteriaceae bacterium]|nr:helix-turn-helix transcriptional regulator [Bifidobacteriaceae bacterium]
MPRPMGADEAPVYVISVAARLAAMHPQTLRQYDRLGLVVPGRARGRGRRYSLRDVAVLREIQRLSAEEGVNLAGIKRILELEAENRALRVIVDQLRSQAEVNRRFFAVGPEGEATALARGRRPARRPVPEGGPLTSRAVIVWRPG